MWCWVLMSAMRYIAVYHPFLHLRVWVLPRRGVQLIVLMSLLLNVSFIGVIEANSKTMKCKETPLFDTTHDLTWWLHLAELSWGFFMPALITLLMDWRVLMINPSTAIVRHHGHYNLTATRSLDDSTARSELNFYTNEMVSVQLV
uniref:G-protein coupled receptors family 2 profile 2 domain-containing protein n=1 Tax=Plectus sambesii TaxID=2011161 RepID=A0A914V6G3_9BILA